MAKVEWSVVLLIVVSISNVNSLYFHIGETDRKCFVQDIPDDTTVIGSYTVELYNPGKNEFTPSSPGIGMGVEVRDPLDKAVLSKVYSSKGRFTFTSQIPGEHVICLGSNSTKWFTGTQLRIHLLIEVGDRAIDYAVVAEKEKLTALQLRFRRVLDKVDQIAKEQNYQRYREERFQQTSQNTNQRILWWSLIQTTVLLGMGYWQMRHLKHFFQVKKLV